MPRASAHLLALPLPQWRVRRNETLELAVAHFLRDCQQRVSADLLSPHTLRQYSQGLGYWLDFCARQHPPLADPREIAPDHLAAYAAWLAGRGNNRISVATWLRIVRAMLNWARQRGYLDYSPFDDFRIRQPKLPTQPGFTAEEVRRMLDAALAQRLHPLRDAAILLLLWDCALRRIEITRLDLEDVIEGEHLAGAITVRGKGDRDRQVELHTQTQRALFDYLVLERPDVSQPALFLARGSRGARKLHRLTAGGITQLVERLAERVAIHGKKLGPHGLRHGSAKAFLESGGRPEDLQVLLGHESIQMSLHYARAFAVGPRRAARQHSPVSQLGLHLGKRLKPGRPKARN